MERESSVLQRGLFSQTDLIVGGVLEVRIDPYSDRTRSGLFPEFFPFLASITAKALNALRTRSFQNRPPLGVTLRT